MVFTVLKSRPSGGRESNIIMEIKAKLVCWPQNNSNYHINKQGPLWIYASIIITLLDLSMLLHMDTLKFYMACTMQPISL